MAAQFFKAKLAPSTTPHKLVPSGSYTLLVKGLFVRHSIVLVAAIVQIAVCLFLSSSYAIVPSAVLLLGFAISSAVHLAVSPSQLSNPYSEGVVRGRVTAQIASADGTHGPRPASQSLVVFHLGVQWNHPLGAASPAGIEVARRFIAMNADLMNRRDELGLISVNEWRGAGIGNASSFQVSYYFRDVESIHRFAHEDMHRKTWDWYNQARTQDVGIYHETFAVPAGSYETIYDNCVPVGLGRGSVKCPDAKGDEGKWVNTLVSADTPALKTQSMRLDRGPNMQVKV